MRKLKEHVSISLTKSLECQTVDIDLEDKSVQCTVLKGMDTKTETKEDFKSIHAIIATLTLPMSII